MPPARNKPVGTIGAGNASAQTSRPVAAAVATTSTTRAASIVALVFGLLIFVPFVTQLIAIGVGVFALGRRRLKGERVMTAWIGVVVGLVTLGLWIVGVGALSAGASRMGGAFPRVVPPPAPMPGDLATRLRTQMARVHAAATAHHRDFGRWPGKVDMLVGSSLPPGFSLAPELTYLRPAPADTSDLNRVLMVSTPVGHDASGDRLTEPQRLVLRLGGKIDLLPVDQVEELLAAQK